MAKLDEQLEDDEYVLKTLHARAILTLIAQHVLNERSPP